MNINERLALFKMAKCMAEYGLVSGREFISISRMFFITEYSPENLFNYASLLIGSIDQDKWFEILNLIFIKYQNYFHLIMGEILQVTFKLTEEKTGSNEKARKVLVNTFERYLDILGYKLSTDFHYKTLDYIDVKIVPRETEDGRKEEQNKLFTILENKYPTIFTALTGAYERYLEGGTDANRQSIDSCRNAYENFFKQITRKQNWKSELNNVIKSSTLIELIKNGIFQYLSGTGTHSPKEREKEDAVLAIRLTEDILIRVLTESGEY